MITGLFWTLIGIWALLIVAVFWAAHKPEKLEDELDRGGHVRVIGRIDGEE